ncbi:class I lanthipeptide [Chitinophaga solisilvae]|uniref:Uncharacterized protein n=1 Tax=Chitinophaga solisilvae TaxID=1233460 RepID=A0A433WKS9_9BACT|nr:class I lanthipeptide [Chitinophaga solisilvae]NSL90923.1 hypothetical protein [Chitinophaga solisilvae]
MKKRKIELSKKLLLHKQTVGQLSTAQQLLVAGGINTVVFTCTAETIEVSVCRFSVPPGGGSCCVIP